MLVDSLVVNLFLQNIFFEAHANHEHLAFIRMGTYLVNGAQRFFPKFLAKVGSRSMV